MSTSPDLTPNPLSYLGKIEARYFTIQLHGVVPVSQATAAHLNTHTPLGDMSPTPDTHPTKLSSPRVTLAATFALTSTPLQQRATLHNAQHLPYLPRNALLLSNIKTLNSWPASGAYESPLTSPDITQYPTDITTSPLLPYPVAAHQLEFFPLSNLRLPHVLPDNQPINLTHWFVAECLASSVTYTSLLSTHDTAQALPLPSEVKLHTYDNLNDAARRFWFGGDAHQCLIEGTLFPASTFTPDTAHLTIADIIDTPPGSAPMPPTSTWFKLTATPRPPREQDIGAIGQTTTVLEFGVFKRTYPAHTHARWMDYALTTHADPSQPNPTTSGSRLLDGFMTRSASRLSPGPGVPATKYRPAAATYAFDAPYFSPTSAMAALHYANMEAAKDYDTAVQNDDEKATLDSGHALAHSLPHITKAALYKEALAYARTLDAQRQYVLSSSALLKPASVVYSDKLCFGRSGMFNSKAPNETLLTRVASLGKGASTHPIECVMNEEQYVRAHEMASRVSRDGSFKGATLAQMDSTDIEKLPDVVYVSSHAPMHAPPDSNKTHAPKEKRKKKAALATTAVRPTPSTDPAAPKRRGRPAGARNRMSLARMQEMFLDLGVLADNVLRIGAQSHFSGWAKRIMDIHNPTHNWTRLTPLMPPASHTSVAQTKYGRGLPIRAINNQHIDSLLWRSLLNRWLNDPRYEKIKGNRPPVLQITKLVDPLTGDAPYAGYHNQTQFAYATVMIPIPATVMHQWLTTGPTPFEVEAVRPLVSEHAPSSNDEPTEQRKGYYHDPRITLIERELKDGVTFDHERHDPLPMYPEVMHTFGVTTYPSEQKLKAMLPQPGPQSGSVPPDHIHKHVDFTLKE